MSKDLGIGVVGLGMGQDLLYVNCDPSSRFEVRAVCARTRGKVESFAAKHGIPSVETDYAKLLKRPDIDVVGLYTPDHLHGEQALAALKAGKHVVVTKPFTTRLDEAVAVARLADKRNLKVIIGETCRFYTSFLNAKKLLDDGKLGELVWVDAWYVHQIGDSLFDITPWRLEAPQDFLYGGVCHPMDTVVWLMGEVQEVHCYAYHSKLAPRYPLRENFLINLRMKSGKIARVVGSYGVVQPPYPMMGLGLYGKKGTAVADFTDFEPSGLKVRLTGEPAESVAGEARTAETNVPSAYSYPVDLSGAYGQGTAVRRYMQDLEEAIVHDRRPSLDAWEGVKTIAALAACDESIKSGKPVRVRSIAK